MSGAIAFLAGLGTGYLNETNRQKKEKNDDEDRALRNEASQLQITAAKKQVADQATLAEAGKPIAMTEGAGGMLKPASMDNRDVGLPENAALPNQGLQVGGYNVAGKQFADPVAAQGAMAAANTPEATNQRILAAQRGIDPSKAIAMQKDIAQGTVADIQASDAVFRNKLGVAMGFGHEGLAKLITESQSDGLAEHQLKAVVSPDGKTVNYNKVDKDGKLTPTTLTYPNTEEGVVAAAYRLDKAITPAMRADFAAKQKKEEREGLESNSKIKLQGAQANYYDSAAQLKDVTDPNAPKGGIKPLVERMSEIDKSTLGNINKQREQINAAITKAQAEGSWDDKNPGSQALKTKLASLALQESKLQTKYAADGGAALPDPLGVRKAPSAPSDKKQGQVEILNQEMTKAQAMLAKPGITPDERGRAETDIASLNRELKNLGVKPGQPAQVPAAPVAPVRNMAVNGTAPVAAAPVTPAAAAVDTTQLAAMAQAESLEMASGKRMKYSPQVAAFVAQQQAVKDAAALAESQAYRQREFQKSNMAVRGAY